MSRSIIAIALGLALSCGAAAAQDEEVQQIPVNGTKNPEMKSYRAVWAGLDMFDKEHALAPAATEVRFRIMTRGGNKCVGVCGASSAQPLNGGEQELTMRIAGDGEPVAVPVSPDGLFTVPRIQAAYDDNADIILNRKKGTYKASAEVRTPGLPDNVRRLGDLRLECKVQVAIAKEEIPFWANALVNSILLTADWCMKAELKGEHIKFAFNTLQPVVSATLVDGERSMKLETGKRSFSVPLGDRSWPDDALVQLEWAPRE